MYRLFFSFLFLTICSPGWASTVFVYRNAASEEEITSATAQRILDGSKLVWKDNKNIVLLLQELDQVDENLFLSFSGLSKPQFLSRWRIKFFSGRALIPVQVKNAAQAIETLKSNPYSVFFSFTELTPQDLGPEKQKISVITLTY